MYIKRTIQNYLRQYLKIAIYELKKDNIEKALDSLYHFCALQHLFNYKLQEVEVEKLLENIANRKFKKLNYKTEKTLVFYDSVALTDSALSMQYLKVIGKLRYRVIYIINSPNASEKAKGLIEYATEQKFKVEIIEKESHSEKSIYRIITLISLYKPEIAFLHMANDDVYGNVAFYTAVKTRKYYINHGDEQFWVGTGIADYVLEFRGMGLDASVEHRGISEKRCLVNPYFPILKSTIFHGFEFKIPNDAFVIFSGGRFVKVYSESEKFLEVVRIILEKYPNTFFVFAGSGNKTPMLDYIEKHGLSTRWKVIGYRSDLLELMKNVDLYLGTYPQSGALMAQYAAAAGTPIVEMNTNNGGVTEDMLPKLKGWTVTMNNWEEYFERIDRLITDNEFRENFSEALKASLITEKEFQENLLRILTTQRSSVNYVRRASNIELRSQRLLESENRYLHRVPGLMSNKLMLRYYPLTALHNILNYFRYKVFN